MNKNELEKPLTEGEMEIYIELDWITRNPPAPQQLYVSLSSIIHRMLAMVYLRDDESKETYIRFKEAIRKTAKPKLEFETPMVHDARGFSAKDNGHDINVPFPKGGFTLGLNIVRHLQYEAINADLWEILTDMLGFLMAHGDMSIYGKDHVDKYAMMAQPSEREERINSSTDFNMFKDSASGED
jgi:hypothetical protein